MSSIYGVEDFQLLSLLLGREGRVQLLNRLEMEERGMTEEVETFICSCT